MTIKISITCIVLNFLSIQQTTAQMRRFKLEDYELVTPARQVTSRLFDMNDNREIFRNYENASPNDNYDYHFDTEKRTIHCVFLAEDGTQVVEQQLDAEGFVVYYKASSSADEIYEEYYERLPYNRVNVRLLDQGEIASEILYEHDRFGRFVKEEKVLKEEADQLYSKRSYHTDAANKVITTDSCFDLPDHSLVSVTITHTDSTGRMVYEFSEMKQLEKFKSEFELTTNEKNQITKVSSRFLYLYESVEELTCVYNERGEVIERKLFKDNKLQLTLNFTYRYDDNGNWIEKHIFLNGVEDAVVKRTILY